MRKLRQRSAARMRASTGEAASQLLIRSPGRRAAAKTKARQDRGRRNFLHLAAGAAALPAVSRAARAQTYPTRTVRIIAGFAAGGGSDITARLPFQTAD